jgi:electron transport complex protein RnfG
MSSKEVSGIRMLAVLGGVCVLSAAMLGFVYKSTEGRIAQNRIKVVQEAVDKVMPGIDNYEQVGEDPVIYRGFTGGEVSGYAVLAKGMGFQGNIVLMVGTDPRVSKISGIIVLESVETPGLGDKIKAEGFLGQFYPMEIPTAGTVSIDTITGATISSVAVEKIINKALEHVKRIS